MPAEQQGRILSIDILKGIAVIGMVLVHFPWLLFLVGHPAPDDPGMGYINHVSQPPHTLA